MAVPEKIRKKFDEALRRRKYDPNYEPDSIADKAVNSDVRRILVEEGKEMGLGVRDMAALLGVTPAIVSREMARIEIQRFRNLPPNWLAAKFVAKLDGLERYEHRAWDEMNRSDDPEEKQMWLGRAIQANSRAGELIAQVASKGKEQNPLLPVIAERGGQPENRESLFQSVYETAVLAKKGRANSITEEAEVSEISEGNGKA